MNARYGFPGAIVAHAWFHTENAEEIIAAQAQFPLVRGIRSKPVTSLRPGAGTPGAPGTMQDDKWLRGFALLEKYGLSWDLRVPYWHLAEAAEVARQFPRTPIVLNHTGFPWDRSEEGLAAWRRGMEAVAREPNVHVKVSEFGLKDSAWDYEFEPAGRPGGDRDLRHRAMPLREQLSGRRPAGRLRHPRPFARPHARGPFAGGSRPLLLEERRGLLPAFPGRARGVTGEKPDWCYPRSMRRRLLALYMALLALPFAAQAQDASAGCPAPARLDDGWTMATPKDAGFDPDKLCPLDKFIGQWTGAKIHGVVVVRHGKLVMERYYKGTDYRPESGRVDVVAVRPDGQARPVLDLQERDIAPDRHRAR